MPNVILDENVPTSVIEVGRRMERSQVFAVGRVSSALCENVIDGAVSKPNRGIDIDPVINCNTLSRVTTTSLDLTSI